MEPSTMTNQQLREEYKRTAELLDEVRQEGRAFYYEAPRTYEDMKPYNEKILALLHTRNSIYEEMRQRERTEAK